MIFLLRKATYFGCASYPAEIIYPSEAAKWVRGGIKKKGAAHKNLESLAKVGLRRKTLGKARLPRSPFQRRGVSSDSDATRFELQNPSPVGREENHRAGSREKDSPLKAALPLPQRHVNPKERVASLTP